MDCGEHGGSRLLSLNIIAKLWNSQIIYIYIKPTYLKKWGDIPKMAILRATDDQRVDGMGYCTIF